MDETILTFNIPAEYAGDRLDRVLRELSPEFSRAQWQRLIREGHVTSKGAVVRANYKVAGNEEIRAFIPPPAPTDIVPENIELDLLYEDDDFIAVNKPAYMVMHPAIGHLSGTLANAVVYHWPDALSIGGTRRPGMVHRLDKETSGVVLVAKSDFALNHLVDQFKDRTIKKMYIALVENRIKPEKALIDAPLGRKPEDRKRMAVIEPGRSATSQPSQTRYELTEAFQQHSLVTCYPITGRTHQIRVHLAYIGYPIVGDHIYGRKKKSLPIKRHFLHARKITFKRPSDNKEMTIEAPLAPELEEVLQALRQSQL
ncbi:MAG: 23S rRNA pseudouridine1911/1915/1917 synthase [Cellvibrionaceae bacterium]|jgi:23S rRNA pseudouridine1911/1915/1917 synthase